MKQKVCHIVVALPFIYLKKNLKAKEEELWKLKYLIMKKTIIKKKIL
jgi:hypothetical protein